LKRISGTGNPPSPLGCRPKKKWLKSPIWETIVCGGGGNPNVVLVSQPTFDITVATLQNLKVGSKLGDDNINSYFKLLGERNLNCLFLNTFFVAKLMTKNYRYTDVKRWKRKWGVPNIFDQSVVCLVYESGMYYNLASLDGSVRIPSQSFDENIDMIEAEIRTWFRAALTM
jgi:hypothetical protein